MILTLQKIILTLLGLVKELAVTIVLTLNINEPPHHNHSVRFILYFHLYVILMYNITVY